MFFIVTEANYIAQLYLLTPRTAPRLFGQESRTYLLYKSPDMANFLLKFSNFRYHGNRGRLSKVTDTIKLIDPENPLVGARIWGVYPAQAQL